MITNTCKYRGELNHLDYSVNEYLVLSGEMTIDEVNYELQCIEVDEVLIADVLGYSL